MSVVELKWQMEGHVTFSKQDVFHGLGEAVPEARSKGTEAPQEGAITPPTTNNIGGVEPHPETAHGRDNTSLASLGCTPNNEAPLAEPTTLPAQTNLPVSVEIPPRGDIMVPAAKIDMDAPRGLMMSQATSPAMVENWVVPTTGLRDKLAGSPTHSDQVGGEKQCILAVTASIGRLNLEATGVTPGDTLIASVRRVAIRNLCMAASLSGLSKEMRVK